MVIYRSKLHATLKRNYQLMPALKWLRLLMNHIPDKYEHLVRYYGDYSNRPSTENPAVFPLQSTPTRVLFVLLNASSRIVAIEFHIPWSSSIFSARKASGK